MSSRSRSRSLSGSQSMSRSRSPRNHRIRSRHYSNHNAAYRREMHRGFRHIASECTAEAQCWNCREPGHVASKCPNEGVCHTCGKSGHRARDCPNPDGDSRLCNNCYKPGHIAADCTNHKACKNCRRAGHVARDCPNEPVCNVCGISGHVARQCPKGNSLPDRGGWGGHNIGHRDVVCYRVGHMSRDCMGPTIICHNCGGQGHRAFECHSGRFPDRGYRSYVSIETLPTATDLVIQESPLQIALTAKDKRDLANPIALDGIVSQTRHLDEALFLASEFIEGRGQTKRDDDCKLKSLYLLSLLLWRRQRRSHRR